jgi:hypothetical protein
VASSDILDAMPEAGSRWYPPWRYRIREVMAFIKDDKFIETLEQMHGIQPIETIRDRVKSRFQALEATASDDSDLTQIAANGILSRAYKDIPKVMSGIRAFIARCRVSLIRRRV